MRVSMNAVNRSVIACVYHISEGWVCDHGSQIYIITSELGEHFWLDTTYEAHDGSLTACTYYIIFQLSIRALENTLHSVARHAEIIERHTAKCNTYARFDTRREHHNERYIRYICCENRVRSSKRRRKMIATLSAISIQLTHIHRQNSSRDGTVRFYISLRASVVFFSQLFCFWRVVEIAYIERMNLCHRSCRCIGTRT